MLVSVVTLALLPVAVVFGASGAVGGPLAVWLGGVAVVVAAVKLAAAVGGLVGRFLDRTRLAAVPATVD